MLWRRIAPSISTSRHERHPCSGSMESGAPFTASPGPGRAPAPARSEPAGGADPRPARRSRCAAARRCPSLLPQVRLARGRRLDRLLELAVHVELLQVGERLLDLVA